MGSFAQPDQQDVTTRVELPPWVEDAMQYNIGLGQQYSQRPYVPYTGDRFQPFNQMQQNAFGTSDLFGQMGLGALGNSYNSLTDMSGQNLMGQAYGGLVRDCPQCRHV